MSKVTVGCRFPNGLILTVGKVDVALNGSNSSTVIGGHGLTEVDAGFWNAWLERNKGLSFVRNGKVFAHEKAKNTKAEAKEKAKEKSGLEPLDPNKTPVGIKAAE
jgi:hypothetical protein